MAIMSAYALASNFNQDHKDLINLKTTLEQKVIDRTRQLEQANQQKTDAFINISHEIKTPLTLIGNYIDKHIIKYKKTEELSIAVENVNKLKRDIKNVLDFEKLDKDMPHYDHSQIAGLSSIVERNVYQFREIADKKDIKLKFNIAPNIYSKIDPSSFDSILINLVGNAIKFTESKGEINVDLKADNEEVELTVSDTGIGISREMQENIFRPYYQVSHKKSNIQGIGMGLNIVKKIVDKAGGFISINSEPDKGTVFRLNFKRYFLQENDKVQFISAKGSNISVESTDIRLKEEAFDNDKKTILIVEDNLQMLSSLQNDLLADYNIFYALNGKEALDKIKNIPKPDIILSDIMMDVMDGYEFYSELLKDDSFDSVPFIFLTAKGSEDDKISSLKKGAVDYITKPFNIEELKARLSSLLKVKEALNRQRIEELTKKLLAFLENNNVSVKDKIIKEEADESEKNDVLFMKHGISRRQIEIFSLLEKGFERKEISDRLNIGLGTVKTHIERLFNKFNVNNKTDLINIIRKNLTPDL